MLQGRLGDALRGHDEARRTFESLGEPGHVAVAWHQIGRVHETAGQFEEAEAAYKRSLAIKQARNDLPGMANTYSQLANCASAGGRPEEAVGWGRRAIEGFVKLGNRPHEALGRSNLAGSLLQLGRLDEAEREARAALAIKEEVGLATEPWTTCHILHEIALARHDTPAAADARTHAMDWYRRYRAQGGQPDSQTYASLLAHTATILAGHADPTKLLALLPKLPPALARTITALLANDPTTARALLPELDYASAVEVELLLNAR